MEQSFHWTGLVGSAVIGLTIGNIIGVVRDGRPARRTILDTIERPVKPCG